MLGRCGSPRRRRTGSRSRRTRATWPSAGSPAASCRAGCPGRWRRPGGRRGSASSASCGSAPGSCGRPRAGRAAAMLVKLPTQESTLRNTSGRSQATVKAQMPPLLMPADRAARRRRGAGCTVFSTSGRISSSRNRAYWSESVSYSKLRFGAGLSAKTPGLMKMPIVTGISPLAIRLSKTVGHVTPSVAAAVLEDHDAGRASRPSYCAGT